MLDSKSRLVRISGMIEDPRIDAYIERAALFARPILTRLRAIVRTACPDVEESIKWSSPSFGYRGSILCSMAAFKQHATFGFWQGERVTGDAPSADERSAMGQFGRLTSVDDLPDEALLFLLPSRYCESDVLADEAFHLFGSTPSGWARVQAISDWANGHLGFQYGASSPSFSARDVFDRGLGVCRDFSHLAITMCRALNIPARYVFGYLPDIEVPDPGTPMDFCAWMEVYLGDGWHTFDPRNNQRRIGRTVIGRGRDAADVAMVTSFGAVELCSMTVIAREAG